MGVTLQTFMFQNKWLKPEVKSICEFGDQQFSCCPPFVELSWTRSYFKNKKMRYDSIDTNGYGDSLMLDLNIDEEVDKHLIENNPYDFVTDYGTLEHVEDYYMGYKNMDKLCKVGGIMIHVLPAVGHWPDHGSWRADHKFFFKLGKKQKYEVLNVHIEPTAISPGHPSDQIYVVYRKTHNDTFVNRETFDTYGAILAYECEKYVKGKLGGGRHF